MWLSWFYQFKGCFEENIYNFMLTLGIYKWPDLVPASVLPVCVGTPLRKTVWHVARSSVALHCCFQRVDRVSWHSAWSFLSEDPYIELSVRIIQFRLLSWRWLEATTKQSLEQASTWFQANSFFFNSSRLNQLPFLSETQLMK